MSRNVSMSLTKVATTRRTSTIEKANSQCSSPVERMVKEGIDTASNIPLQNGTDAGFCMESSQASFDLTEPSSDHLSSDIVLLGTEEDGNGYTSSLSFSISSNGRGRRRGRGVGRVANRSMRTSVTFQHKLEVIDYFDSHAKDINTTVQKFYAHLDPMAIASRKRQIYKWVKSRALIEEMCFKKTTSHQTRRRNQGTATTLPDAAERALAKWMKNEQKHNSQLSKQMLRSKAMEIAEQYNIPKGTFQATWTWQKGFFKRHQISI